MKNNKLFFKAGFIIPCICCKADIRLMHDTDLLEQAMWNDGIVDRIAAPYGSIHDGSMYIVGICDDCISKNEERMVYVGNYMDLSSDNRFDELQEPYKKQMIENTIKRDEQQAYLRKQIKKTE